MTKLRSTLQAAALLVFMLAFASLAHGQATRTWVSGVGDDVNPCSRTAPCKTWAGAISKTAAGGEIDALDPGGFGTLTATKSITVEGTQGQGFGSTLASGTTGFIVNDSLTASPGTIVVRLRNLSINGAGTTLGTHGINFVSGKALEVESCRIYNFSTSGIRVANTAGNVQLIVRDTMISDVTADGIILSPSNTVGVSATADLENVRIYRCNNGLTMQTGATRATMRNSTVTLMAGAAGNGINLASGSPIVEIQSTQISHNTKGINTVVGTTNISDCYIANNGTSMSGNVHSFSDNRVINNGVNTLPTQDLTKR
jgi:hypothetical protein